MPEMFGFFRKDASVQAVHSETALGNASTAKPKVKLKKPIPDSEIGEDATVSVDKHCHFLKVDETHGLVLGFAIVCKKDGADYFDKQDDHIPEDAMLAAAVDFMSNSRVAKEMHEGEANGTILFAFPLTSDIAKALEIETKTTGLLIAMKPSDPAVLAKFKDGTYSGFSIGGKRITDEEIAA